MKILAIGTYKATDGKDYFTIVIDKVAKIIFALQNFSCRADEERYLKESFHGSGGFYFVHSGTSIDENLIPKKYSKFQILQ